MSGLPLFGLLIGQNVMKRNRRPQSNTIKAANNDGFEVRSAEKAISDVEQPSDASENTVNDLSTELKSCDDGVENDNQCGSDDGDRELNSCDADDENEINGTDVDQENEHTN